MKRAGTLLALLWPAIALALDPNRAITQYVHEVWTTRDGLPINRFEHIAQSGDGYLWLAIGPNAPAEGLVRFDGVRFTVFDEKSGPLSPEG